MLKVTTRYMRNHEDAEDAVQDAFLRAYCGLRLFRGESAFYSWLHRIATNSAKTAISLRARNAIIITTDTLSVARDHGAMQSADFGTPEALALTDEISAAVGSAIEALCDELRTAIVLREIDGLSYKQIASAMSCPVGTVRSRVYRAREAIDHRLLDFFDDGLGRTRYRRAIRPVPTREVDGPHMNRSSPDVKRVCTAGDRECP